MRNVYVLVHIQTSDTSTHSVHISTNRDIKLWISHIVQDGYMTVYYCYRKERSLCRCVLITHFLVVFFSKKLAIVVVRDVCPSVCPSVEIIPFRGISISNWPIDLKMSMNVRKGAVHVRKA